MESDLTGSLAERVARLEHNQGGRLRTAAVVFGLGVVAGLAGGAVASAHSAGATRSESFILVDSNGRERGGLIIENGTALLRLRDERGETTVELGGAARAVPVR